MEAFLNMINKFLAKFDFKLIKEIKTDASSKTGYEVLLPSIDCDQDDYYEDALNFALRNKEVNNIAVTGPYGSGKSSFIKKYKHSNPKWNYLDISLATFTDIQHKSKPAKNGGNPKKDGQHLTEEDQEIRNQNIEWSILQQIFYKEKASKIPFSRFKRVINLNKFSLFLHSFGIATVFTYSLYMLWPDKINKLLFFDKLGLNTFIDKYYYFFIFPIAILFFYYFLISFKYLTKLRISKFSPKDLSIDLNEKNTDRASIFNEHIDEIIYFFQVTNYEIVIIEDLDRHEDTDIFIKLRELNGLINSSKDIKRNHGGVRFIYAVRDDMFVNNERTKFFDYIIPIIPYINPNNSYEKLKEKFSEDTEKGLSLEFLNDIALFVDDMRLLLNIYNEYKLYREKIDHSNRLDKNKLLALILYKNFCPIEFSKLHSNNSIINTILAAKPEYIKAEISELIKNNDELENKIEAIRQESIDNLQELKMIYMCKIVEETGGNFFAVPEVQNRQQVSYFMKDNNFDSLIGKNIQGFGDNYQKKSTSFQNIENLISDKLSYRQREELIQGKNDNSISKLLNRIEINNETIERVKSLTLSELMQNIDIYKHHKDIDVCNKESQLLKYLLSEGYINEDYHYYISFFHEGDIALSDLKYLLSVKNKEASLDFEYELVGFEGVLKKLNPRNFETAAILNFSLLHHLLETQKQPYLKYLLDKINDLSEKSIEFAIKYLEEANKESRSKLLLSLWGGFFEHIFNEAKFSDDRMLKFFIYLLELASLINIKRFNINGTVSDYVSNISTLPKLSNQENITFKELLNNLKIKFTLIKDFSQNKPLFEYIYENNYYLINVSNLEKIFEYYNGDLESFKVSNYTTINSGDFMHLKKYIESHIEDYVNNVVLELTDNCDESEESLIILLNSDKLYKRTKLKIIHKTQTKLTDITMVNFDAEIWNELLLLNRVVPAWENIMQCFHSFDASLSESLLSYLNTLENYNKLGKVKLNNGELLGKELRELISTTLLFNKDLSDDAYSEIVDSITYYKYHTVCLEGLSELKIDKLLAKQKIFLTAHNIEELKKYYSNKLPRLIDAFKVEFIDEFRDLPFTGDDYARILKDSNLSGEEKQNVINNMNQELIVGNATLAKVIIEILSSVEVPIELALFNKLITDSEGVEAVKLLVRQAPSIEDKDIELYLRGMGGSYAQLPERTRARLEISNNPHHVALLNILKDRKIISSFDPKPTYSGNRIVRRFYK